MERDANYAAVGAFILLVVAMGVAFVIWYSDTSDGSEYKLYEIYFTGSVSGLNRGSPVRYLGVDVGRVRRLTVDAANPSQVQATVEIDDSAPISGATRASLGLQGVTGLLFIDLKETSSGSREAPLRTGARHPVIESVPSDFDVFLASVPEVMGRANELLDRIQRVLSDENIAGVSAAIADVRKASAGLPRTAQNVDKLIAELNGTVDEMHAAAISVRELTQDARPEVAAAIARLNETAENLAKASANVEEFTRTGQAQLGSFTNQGLFELERLIRETRSATHEFRDLSRSLRANPSQILYEPPASGVEIQP